MTQSGTTIFPVVGISWFEAEAYGNWLNTRNPVSDMPEGYVVRLPTEEEWERSARGVHGREYPWGDKFDFRYLSCTEAWEGKKDIDWFKWLKNIPGVAATTAVCTYSQGVSPEGIWDAAGNIWEWTASWYEADRVNRVLRGGSWFNDQGHARCTFRDGNFPVDFSDLVGFRVVVSLVSSES
jgi:formylglycine-generating enzyme required for sulfatase activity